MLSDFRFRRGGVLTRLIEATTILAIFIVAGCNVNKPVQFGVVTTSAQLPAGQINVAYTQTTLTAANGTAPYMWTVTGGALPAGMSLSTAGILSGTPTASGSFNFTVQATDSATPTARTATASLTLKVNQPPAITSTNGATFTVGTAGTFTVTATGSPAPTFSETGALPSGVTLSSAGVLSGTAAAGSGGTYPITITAQNGVTPNATQSFTLTVNQAPAVTSANTTAFAVGAAGTFAVTATGFPAPTLSETGTLPTGVTFNTATGVLSGTPASGQQGSYPIMFTAHNGIGADFVQNFTLTVGLAPAITSLNNATFTVGASGTFTVTATGFPAPTFSETGALPAGVSLSSAGVLSGTPGAATGKAYSITITAQNGISPNASQTFTLTVDQAPAITSGNSATFAVGTAGTFTVAASGFPAPTFSESGSLPNGVTLNTTTGVLSGTPAPGTQGPYPITITAQNGVTPNATQSFTLTVGLSPAITSASNATFTVGTSGTFTVTAAGFPAPTFSETGTLPTGVTLNSTTGVLSGTPGPGTGKTYPISITAQNGVTPNATQNFTLTVDEAPSIISSNNATFTVGTFGSFTEMTTGFPHPVLGCCNQALPVGVSFLDNGDGTGTLSGTPQPGSSGVYSLRFTAINNVGTNASQIFTLTVDLAPAITSATNATFTAGTPGTFTVVATGLPAPTFSETGALPSGVTLNSTTGALSGTPGSGTGGTYPITITAQNGVSPNATQAFTLTVDQAPAITSQNNTTFAVGSASSFTVTASGFPAPTFSETGTLPTGVSFNTTTGVLSGTPASGTQTSSPYMITFTAQNGVGTNGTQSFTLTVSFTAPPSFTSSNNTTFAVGTAGSFTVTASGSPAPTFSESGTLPTGVSLNTTTGALSGTPAAGTGGTYPITITAHNGIGADATQSFTLTVDQAPAITSGNNTTFSVGANGTFTVTATGFPAPTFSETGALPAGVTLNSTTGVLSGTPGTGTQGSYPITITAQNGTIPNATQGFTLTVNVAPVITSANQTTFTVGAAGTFTVTATGSPAPTFSETGTLPSGVTLNSTTGVLSGTPAAGTGGSYPITITAQNGSTPNGTQSFTLTVDQAPAITSALSVSFTTGTFASFTVQTSGFPVPSLSDGGATLPGGVTFVDNGNGTGTLSGTPGGSGSFPITFTASNGVGSPANQSFTLIVNSPVSYSITGTLTYSGTKTGSFRTFIRVYSTGNTCTGNCGGAVAATSLASEPSSTGTTYTIRGLQQGTYNVIAEIDTLNNGAPNASNPWGQFSSLTINSSSPSNVSVPSFALTDRATPTPVAPILNPGDAVPGSTFVLVQYDQHNSSALQDSNGRELATSYKVYWGTDVNATNGAGSPATFAARGTHDNNYIVRNLASGKYYFQVSALVGSVEAKSSIVSATLPPAAGAFTFSGTVTFPGTATGPLYVGLFDGKNSAIYGKEINLPYSSGVAFSVTGVPAGNYQAFAIIDQNNNGLIEPSDISNVTSNQGGPPPLTVSTSNVTGYAIALTSAVSTVSVTTYHQQNMNNTPTDFYNLNLGISWGTKRPVAMTLLSGPNAAVPWDLPIDSNNGENVNLNGATPVTGDTYQFQVTFSDGSTQTIPVSITVLNSFVTGMTVQTTAPGTVTVPYFNWVAPASPPSPYTYNVGLYSVSGSNSVQWQDFGGQNSNGIASGTTTIQFNQDGSATSNGSPITQLPASTNYQWFVGVQDANGNTAQEISTYNIP